MANEARLERAATDSQFDCHRCGRHALSLFFFSSRRRHTRCYRDWSSDVCSSDLPARRIEVPFEDFVRESGVGDRGRSEERRVGKSVDLGGRRIIKKKKKAARRKHSEAAGLTETSTSQYREQVATTCYVCEKCLGSYSNSQGPNSVFFFQAEDGIRGATVTGVQTCALPIFGQGEGPLVLVADGSVEQPAIAQA